MNLPWPSLAAHAGRKRRLLFARDGRRRRRPAAIEEVIDHNIAVEIADQEFAAVSGVSLLMVGSGLARPAGPAVNSIA